MKFHYEAMLINKPISDMSTFTLLPSSKGGTK